MKKKIKIISFVFVLSILTSLFTFIYVCSASAFVNLSGTTTALMGEDVDLNLSIEGLNLIAPDGIKTFGPIKITYDTNILIYKNTVLTFPDKDGFTYKMSNPKSGEIFIDIIAPDEPKIIRPSTTSIATIKFSVGKNVKSGPTDVSISGANDFGIKLLNDEIIDSGNFITFGPLVTINIPNKPSNNAELISLVVENKDLTPSFNPNTLMGYSLTVPNEVSNINVKAVASDSSNAKIVGTGIRTLNVGMNIVTVEVTAQDLKTKKNYVISVERLSTIISSKTQVSSVNSGIVVTDKTIDNLNAEIKELKDTNKSILEQFSVVTIILITLIGALVTALIILIINIRNMNRE